MQFLKDRLTKLELRSRGANRQLCDGERAELAQTAVSDAGRSGLVGLKGSGMTTRRENILKMVRVRPAKNPALPLSKWT